METVKKFRNLKYVNRDFESLVQEFIDYIKVYFPNTYGDFTPTSTGMMFVELISYFGDIFSYYQDRNYRELFDPSELKNAINLLKLFGGKYKAKTQANLNATLFLLVPASNVSGAIDVDEDYLPIIRKGMTASTNDGKQFISVEDVYFENEIDRDYAPYSVNNSGDTETYIVSKNVKMVSGIVNTFQYDVEDPTPFLKIALPSEHNVLEIISVTDSDGNDWYEVEYLAQDEIFIYRENQNNSSKYVVPQILERKQVAQRFITETDENGQTFLIFGSSNGNSTAGVSFPNPGKYLVNNISNNLGFFSFNNSLLLNSGSLGISPSNTTLTIQYLHGGGTEYNILTGEINTILSKNIVFNKRLSDLDLTKYNNVVNSLTITNNEPGKDAIDSFSVEELKQLIPMYYNSQKRAITPTDYLAIVYSLPSKFGGVYRAAVQKLETEPETMNLYILTLDKNSNFAVASSELKSNLLTFLSKYKQILTSINIRDAEIINFRLEFEIIVKDEYNKFEVLEKVRESLKDYFSKRKFNFGENIYISKLVNIIDDVEGVLTVTDLFLYNITDSGYSTTEYNFKVKSISNIIEPPEFGIFEMKYMDQDIIGHAK